MTATVIACGGGSDPSGPERVGLSVCVEERATVWTYECLKRVPLEIDVVP